VAAKGRKWKEIGLPIRRTGEQCRDRWRKIGLGSARVTGERRAAWLVGRGCCWLLFGCRHAISASISSSSHPALFSRDTTASTNPPNPGAWSVEERTRLEALVTDYLNLSGGAAGRPKIKTGDRSDGRQVRLGVGWGLECVGSGVCVFLSLSPNHMV
jgi:hypothetical protein